MNTLNKINTMGLHSVESGLLTLINMLKKELLQLIFFYQ